MRRVLVRCTIVVLLCTAWPSAAEAGPWSFWAWLEELSGPGPFKGVGFSLPWRCYGVPIGRSTYEVKNDWDCDNADPNKTRVVIDVDFLFLWSVENKLLYPPTVSGVPRVWISTAVPSVNLRVHPMLTVGSGFGFAVFRTTKVDKTEVRAVLQPVRVAVRPFAAFVNSASSDRKKRMLDMFQIHFDATTFHPGFEASDFGAIEGTFSAPYELQWSTKLMVDFSKLK